MTAAELRRLHAVEDELAEVAVASFAVERLGTRFQSLARRRVIDADEYGVMDDELRLVASGLDARRSQLVQVWEGMEVG